MAGCHYEILHSELQGFDVYRTMDIRFMFAAQVNRQMTFRLAFFAKAAAEIPLLIKQFGDDIADANLAVVSFYNLEAQDNPDCDMFDRPPAAAALTLHETLFFYASLIDIILQVARRENIQLLAFQAYTPQLIKVYDRLVRQQAGQRNLRVFKEGANYVLQTDN